MGYVILWDEKSPVFDQIINLLNPKINLLGNEDIRRLIESNPLVIYLYKTYK